MLDLATVCAEPARVKAALGRRGVAPEAVERVTDLDGRWAAREAVAEALRVRRRQVSRQVADRRLAAADTADLARLGRAVAEELRGVEQELAALDAARRQALLVLPNLPASDVPDSPVRPGAAEGPSRPSGGREPAVAPAWPHPFPPLPHWDLLDALGLVEPHAGPGRGFVVWREAGARLLRAMTALMLDVHARDGCREVLCPALATAGQLFGSAHLPTLADKMYAISPLDEGDGGLPPAARMGGPAPRLYLAPRAEPHLAALHAGGVLGPVELPRRYVAAGPAFRREIGAAGREARGLLRLHEFPTVERYTFCRPDQAEAELERAVEAATAILGRLDLVHRRRVRPAPLLSQAAARTVDLEVWAQGAGEWLRVTALSDFTDFQARRTDTRFRQPGGGTRLVHTVGGAAVALPRALAAILETGQQADGSVVLPAALHGYFGGDRLAAGGSAAQK